MGCSLIPRLPASVPAHESAGETSEDSAVRLHFLALTRAVFINKALRPGRRQSGVADFATNLELFYLLTKSSLHIFSPQWAKLSFL